MKPTQPYQPLLLRLLHGLNGLFAIAALVTAFWTYNTYDGRWGKLLLPEFNDIEGIHGTFGLYTLLIFPFFVIYACRRGQKRLIQTSSLTKLKEIGKPIWWFTLHRFANTLSIFGLTFALFSGKMMNETWLPKGELNHIWYYIHLISWVVVLLCIALHLLMSAKIGGSQLLLSMLDRRFRTKDSPNLWRNHVLEWWKNWRLILLLTWFESVSFFKVIEAIVLFAIATAWILPLFKST
jgi:hypothetical protein